MLWKDADPDADIAILIAAKPNTQAEMNRSARKLPNPLSRPLLDLLS